MTCPWCRDTRVVAGQACVACASGGKTLEQLRFRDEGNANCVWCTPTRDDAGERQVVTERGRISWAALELRSLPSYGGHHRLAFMMEQARFDTAPALTDACARAVDFSCDGTCGEAIGNTEAVNYEHAIATYCTRCWSTDEEIQQQMFAHGGPSECAHTDDRRHDFGGVPSPELRARLRRRKARAKFAEARRRAKAKAMQLGMRVIDASMNPSLEGR